MADSNALAEGQKAGTLQLPASLNPYELGTEAHADWERGRLATTARLAHYPCRYVAGRKCDCGGRGFCLDVA